MTIDEQTLLSYILIFARMTSMIAFNPLLARRGVPAGVRMALVLGCTLVIQPLVQAPAVSGDPLLLVFAIFKELVTGMVCGFIFQIYYYLLVYAGDVMDVQSGMSMAKIFDPGSDIQMSVSGRLLELMFFLYFFATDSHLVMIRVFTSSYDVLPMGQIFVGENLGSFLLELFTTVFSLATRLTLPFIAAGLVLEIALGVLMKLVPQINAFVISFPLRITVGFLLLLLFASPISNFIDNYTSMMLQNMETALYVLRGGG